MVGFELLDFFLELLDDLFIFEQFVSFGHYVVSEVLDDFVKFIVLLGELQYFIGDLSTLVFKLFCLFFIFGHFLFQFLDLFL